MKARTQPYPDLTPAQYALMVENVDLARWYLARRGKWEGGRNWDVFWSHSMEALWLAAMTWDGETAKFHTWAVWKLRGGYSKALTEIDYLKSCQRVKAKGGGFADPGPPLSLSDSPQIDGAPLSDLIPEPDRDMDLMIDAASALRRVVAACNERQALAVLQTVVHGKTLDQVAARLGVCRERVRQLRDAGIKNVRKTYSPREMREAIAC